MHLLTFTEGKEIIYSRNTTEFDLLGDRWLIYVANKLLLTLYCESTKDARHNTKERKNRNSQTLEPRFWKHHQDRINITLQQFGFLHIVIKMQLFCIGKKSCFLFNRYLRIFLLSMSFFFQIATSTQQWILIKGTQKNMTKIH